MEMREPTFNMGDIWQELAKELGISSIEVVPGDQFYTANEFAERWNISITRVRQGLMGLKKKGVLIVGRKKITAIDDRAVEVSAYAIREESKSET